MISPISSTSAASQVSATQTNATPKTPTPAQLASQIKDTVHLSAAALGKSGDVDHDGDSH